ncbi:MAG TPA: histidinol-phosphatase [Bacteroidales bacterium]|nr:histidinol-phosphatase [Bacteroidales bacterium]
MNFNLHTHTRFSDGSSDPEDYIKEAIHQGFDTLGFSDHSPVPFENNFAIREEEVEKYIQAILQLKNTYSFMSAAPGINILLALEIDYIPGVTLPINHYHKKHPFDYFIGSVHLVKNEDSGKLWFIDGPDIKIYDNGLKEIFSGDARMAVTAYYRQVQEMIVTQKPDIVGHLDKIKMYNRDRFFSEEEPWYVKLVEETLDLAAAAGCVIEVNTRGIYKKRSETLFPGPEVLKKIRLRNIPVTITSDAHKPHELSLCFEETRKALMDLGFESTWLKTATGWKEISLR